MITTVRGKVAPRRGHHREEGAAVTRREPFTGDVHVHDPVPGDLFPDTRDGPREETADRLATPAGAL
ncbi:MAG: hypothetical protein IRY90_15790 [Actinomadura rubrobrunea]|nr:hypothetical protein [Actinomadura rubrobrunea]